MSKLSQRRGELDRQLAGMVLAGIGIIFLAGCGAKNQYQPPPPPPVTVATPLKQTVTSFRIEIGTTEAVERVELRARVRGFLEKFRFQPGQRIKNGQLVGPIIETPTSPSPGTPDVVSPVQAAEAAEPPNRSVLFVIEKQLYQAEVYKQQAALAAAQAEYKNALARYNRAVELAKNKTITQEELQQREAEKDVAAAAIYSAEALLNEANINLGYCDVRSPIDGRIGKSLVKVGNLVDPNEATLLATVINYDPIYVNFSLSDADLLTLRAKYRKGNEEEVDKESIRMQLKRSIDQDFRFEGHFDSADLDIDADTGTDIIRGIFPNPHEELVPGLTVRVRIPGDEIPNALLIPRSALSFDQEGTYLLIANDKDLVERRNVTLGLEVEGMQVVTSGLSETDRVIIAGIQRARVGLPVSPQQATLPKVQTTGLAAEENYVEEPEPADDSATPSQPADAPSATGPSGPPVP